MTTKLTFNDLPEAVHFLSREVSDLKDMIRELSKTKSVAAVDEVLTIEQAAEFLNLTKQTVYGLVSAGKIPYSKPTGSRLYFSRLALIQWLNANSKAAISDQATQYEAARATRRKSANPQARNAA